MRHLDQNAQDKMQFQGTENSLLEQNAELERQVLEIRQTTELHK